MHRGGLAALGAVLWLCACGDAPPPRATSGSGASGSGTSTASAASSATGTSGSTSTSGVTSGSLPGSIGGTVGGPTSTSGAGTTGGATTGTVASSSTSTTSGSTAGSSTSSSTSTTTSGTSSTSTSTTGTTGTSGAQACAGLMPSSLGTPIDEVLDSNFECLAGFGDDEGDALLTEWFDNGPPATTARFFTYANGQATDTGKSIGANDESTLSIQGQPDGFVVLRTGSAGVYLETYDAHGAQTGNVHFGDVGNFPNVEVASSIAGDIYVGVTPAGGGTATLQRYDVHLNPVGAPVTFPGGTGVTLLGVSRSGHVLALSGGTSGEHGQWFTADLQPLTSSFLLGPENPSTTRPGGAWRNLVMLADGSLALRADTSHYSWIFPDGQTQLAPVPAWIQARGGSDFFPIRGFTGYAAIPPGPGCTGTLEILSADGTSCGCVETGDLGQTTLDRATLGRDGTLFVPRTATVNGRSACEYHGYPQLLR